MNFDQKKEIIEEIIRRTKMPAYSLEIQKDRQPGLFDSKFGGIPYWDKNKECPADSRGNKLMFLAQINLAQIKLDSRLPRYGMLQFFIAMDDVFGMNSDWLDEQDTFRVVYHEEIDTTVSKEQVMNLNIPISTEKENEEYTPIFKEAAIKMIQKDACMSAEDYRFKHLFREIAKEKFGEDPGEGFLYHVIGADDYNKLEDELPSAMGHWIFGFPYFTQNDPRDEEEEYKSYDTLLLQIDSDMIDREDYVLWGDCGVANFFINQKDLENLDFSKVLYNWDCC